MSFPVGSAGALRGWHQCSFSSLPAKAGNQQNSSSQETLGLILCLELLQSELQSLSVLTATASHISWENLQEQTTGASPSPSLPWLSCHVFPQFLMMFAALCAPSQISSRSRAHESYNFSFPPSLPLPPLSPESLICSRLCLSSFLRARFIFAYANRLSKYAEELQR